MSKLYISDILKTVAVGTDIVVRGWVRTKRSSKNVTFLNINDGTTIHNIQAVVEEGVVSEEVLARINTGACIAASGTLIESMGNQKVELKVKSVEI